MTVHRPSAARSAPLATAVAALVTSFLLLAPSRAGAEEPETRSVPESRFFLDLPLLDLPMHGYAMQMRANHRAGAGALCGTCGVDAGDFFAAYADPSMRQTVAMAQNVHGAAYFGWNLLWNSVVPPTDAWTTVLNRAAAHVTAAASDYALTMYAPFGAGFAHEEFHRNVMTQRGIHSYDEIWDGALQRVSGVRDADLVYLKRRFPAEQVRLSSAGIEAHYQLVRELQIQNFFYDANYASAGLSLALTFYAIDYMNAPLSPGYDALVDDLYSQVRTEKVRDFTGVDSAAWVYDLFRPDEPYEARGTAPGGTGIARYVYRRQMTENEVSFLRRAGRLQYLNLLSPALLGIPAIHVGGGAQFNVALRSYPAPYGVSTSFDFFWRTPKLRWLATLDLHQSRELSLPGVSLQWRSIRLPLEAFPLELDARLALWLQPKDLRFHATEMQPGVFVGTHLRSTAHRVVQPFLELEAKSDGWIAGNPFLGANFTARAGVQIEAFARAW